MCLCLCFGSALFFTAHNDAAPVPNAVLKVWLPNFLQVQSISVPPDQIINDTLCWQIGPMDFNASFVVSILVRTAPAIGIGTPVPLSAYVSPISGDLTPANNFFTNTGTVVGAYDPNDKLVEPAQLTETSAEQLPELIYTVRFQNTGNYPADFVVIRDTLSPDFDLGAFRLLGSSHPCTWEALSGQILLVRFDDILLPDSLSDPQGSQGFVQFAVRPKSAVAAGHAFRNVADIYFDFNPPIRTNTAETKVLYFTPNPGPQPGTGLSIRPNPVAYQLTVSWTQPAPDPGADIWVYDLCGQLALQKPIAPGAFFQVLDVSTLQEGYYLLTYRSGNEILRRQFLVLRGGGVRWLGN